MMAKKGSTIALEADPNDPEDFAVTHVAVEQALEARRQRAGRPVTGSGKQLVSLRIDRDILERFKAGGPGWQSRINDALRQATS